MNHERKSIEFFHSTRKIAVEKKPFAQDWTTLLVMQNQSWGFCFHGRGVKYTWQEISALNYWSKRIKQSPAGVTGRPEMTRKLQARLIGLILLRSTGFFPFLKSCVWVCGRRRVKLTYRVGGHRRFPRTIYVLLNLLFRRFGGGGVIYILRGFQERSSAFWRCSRLGRA